MLLLLVRAEVDMAMPLVQGAMEISPLNKGATTPHSSRGAMGKGLHRGTRGLQEGLNKGPTTPHSNRGPTILISSRGPTILNSNKGPQGAMEGLLHRYVLSACGHCCIPGC